MEAVQGHSQHCQCLSRLCNCRLSMNFVRPKRAIRRRAKAWDLEVCEGELGDSRTQARTIE